MLLRTTAPSMRLAEKTRLLNRRRPPRLLCNVLFASDPHASSLVRKIFLSGVLNREVFNKFLDSKLARNAINPFPDELSELRSGPDCLDKEYGFMPIWNKEIS